MVATATMRCCRRTEMHEQGQHLGDGVERGLHALRRVLLGIEPQPEPLVEFVAGLAVEPRAVPIRRG